MNKDCFACYGEKCVALAPGYGCTGCPFFKTAEQAVKDKAAADIRLARMGVLNAMRDKYPPNFEGGR